MSAIITRILPETPDTIAPDGSEVRILASSQRGSMAHFLLPPGQTSIAVSHRTVEEVWYIVSGEGRMWRKSADDESITDLRPGTSLNIPVSTHFQFRNDGKAPLEAIGVTMPPWPGIDEAYPVVGQW